MGKYISLVAFLVSTVLASHTSSVAGQVPCEDPVPTERNWWHWRASSNPDSSAYSSAPSPPPVASPSVAQGLAGRYQVTLIQTLGGEAQERMTLVLRAGPGSGSDERRVLWGYIIGADSSRILGHQPIDPASRDPGRPGVEGWLWENGSLEFWVGNSGEWTDAGIALDVFTISPAGFGGRWVDGAAITVVENGIHLGPPQGYFCAVRLPA